MCSAAVNVSTSRASAARFSAASRALRLRRPRRQRIVDRDLAIQRRSPRPGRPCGRLERLGEPEPRLRATRPVRPARQVVAVVRDRPSAGSPCPRSRSPTSSSASAPTIESRATVCASASRLGHVLREVERARRVIAEVVGEQRQPGARGREVLAAASASCRARASHQAEHQRRGARRRRRSRPCARASNAAGASAQFSSANARAPSAASPGLEVRRRHRLGERRRRAGRGLPASAGSAAASSATGGVAARGCDRRVAMSVVARAGDDQSEDEPGCPRMPLTLATPISEDKFPRARGRSAEGRARDAVAAGRPWPGRAPCRRPRSAASTVSAGVRRIAGDADRRRSRAARVAVAGHGLLDRACAGARRAGPRPRARSRAG